MNFFVFVFLTCATALLPLLCLLLKAAHILFLTRQRKKKSTEAKARILGVRVANEGGRRISFARLNVEIFTPVGGSFVADVEGFYSQEELSGLRPGAVIRVRCLPGAGTWLRIVKAPARKRGEKKPFAKDRGGITATATGAAQSRAARPRRLAFP